MKFINKNTLLVVIALGLYIIGFFSSFPYLLEFERESSSVLDTLRSLGEYSVMFLSFLAFCIVFAKKNQFFKVIINILIIALVLNFSLSASCFFIYKQGFNIGMMLSIFETNVSEVSSMVKTLFYPILATVVFYISVMIIKNKRVEDYGVHRKYMVLFSSLWILLPVIFYIKHKYISNKGGGIMIKSVFYHAWYIKGALDLRNEINTIKDKKINYQLVKEEEEPVQNIIILVGESARRRNMSLYGYTKRMTTPVANAERKNMLLYKNAYAPASITNLAVPIVLSNVDISNYHRNMESLNDNILNVANQLGYDTHWYSTQGGALGITAIASFAKNKKWINGFDDALIPYLREAMNNQAEKRFIVLHINGSHPYSCDKYPKKEALWEGGIDECYDNSIRFTDKVIGKILDEIRDKNSVLVYLSDHGQMRDKDKYIHGDYKEASEVPYFIWYSDKVNLAKIKRGGEILDLTSTAILYADALSLMGVRNPKTVDNSGKYLNLGLQAINYENLK